MAQKCIKCNKKLSQKWFNKSPIICDTCITEMEKQDADRRKRRERYAVKKAENKKQQIEQEEREDENEPEQL